MSGSQLPSLPHEAIFRPDLGVGNAGMRPLERRDRAQLQVEIRFYLNQRRRLRDRALFDLAIDSKLSGCDLVQMKIGHIVSVGGGKIRTRAIVMQQKTGSAGLVADLAVLNRAVRPRASQRKVEHLKVLPKLYVQGLLPSASADEFKVQLFLTVVGAR